MTWLWLLGGAIAAVIVLLVYALCNIAGILDEAERRRMTVPPREER